MSNKRDYIELGLDCANICETLDRGMNGKKLGDLSQSVCEAINQLVAWVNQAIHSLDTSLTMFSNAEQWQRSKGRSLNRAGGMQSPGYSMRRTTRKQLLPGG